MDNFCNRFLSAVILLIWIMISVEVLNVAKAKKRIN